MKILVSKASIATLKAPLVVVPVFEGEKFANWQPADVKGKLSKTYLLYGGHGGCERVLFLGLGKQKEVDREKVRKAFAAAIKRVKDLDLEKFSVLFRKFPGLSEHEGATCMVEGLLLGGYTFDKYKTKEKEEKEIGECTIAAQGNIEKAVAEATLICETVMMVRNMANENADVMTTEKLAEIARNIAKTNNLKLTIIEKQELQKLGMNLLLAVGSGSRYLPKLIILEYNGNPKSKERIALIGKGITFDSGGLNLKPSGYIETMKQDMTGAATVMAVVKTAAELKLKVNAVAVAPVCENMIGPLSYKPGDVIKSYSGKTVEVENTDAEGRLILGDAIAYTAKNLKPTQMIDIATLTGSAAVIFGEFVTPLIGSGKYKKQLFEAGEKTYDRVWELPLYEEFMEEVKGEIADVRNLGYNKRYAGTLMGAAFLAKFADDVPLIHLDIGGTAWYEKPRGYVPKNASGAGVRLLIEFLRSI